MRYLSTGDKQHIPTIPGATQTLDTGAHNPLASVAKNCVAQSLSSSKSNATGRAALLWCCSYDCRKQPTLYTLSCGKNAFKVTARLDGAQRGTFSQLDGQPLATLGTTTGEDLTAALGSHTGAEAVALCALALVRLIRTLHGNPPEPSLLERAISL